METFIVNIILFDTISNSVCTVGIELFNAGKESLFLGFLKIFTKTSDIHCELQENIRNYGTSRINHSLTSLEETLICIIYLHYLPI